MKQINKSFRKKDAMQLLTGQPLYTNDLAPKECLIVKVLRSPHANAIVESINTAIAKKVPGIEAIFTYEDVDQDAPRYTNAGQTYPEATPHDRLLLDRHVRSVGDVVAIVAGENEKAVDKALKLIKVKYQVLEAVLDFRTAKDNPILVHPEDTWESLSPVGADNKRNLCSHQECGTGDVDKILSECDVVVDRVYHTKANQQNMMEPFRTFCEIDPYGRLHITSSTQIVFHVRRIIAFALHIPTSKIRVTKPRIGGGFGAKQSSISEVYPAFVTWKTKKPSKILFTREEVHTAGSPRHEMEMHVRVGATKEGKIRAIDMYSLSNTGAYGEHGPTTVELTGRKSIPMYRTEAYRFVCDVVYTNIMAAGAYRGYGAPQGCFALECAVHELASILGIDAFKIREMNMVHEGDFMASYYDSYINSSALDRCVAKVKAMSRWDEHPLVEDLGDGKVRAWGMSMAMQGSSIPFMDIGGATLRVSDEGKYNLLIGASDMGTGCDTILAQIAAEVLGCETDDITTFGADTDISPYDSGSYASSTTYATGKAVELCAQELVGKICAAGAELLGCSKDDVEFDGREVIRKVPLKDAIPSGGPYFPFGTPAEKMNSVSLHDISFAVQYGRNQTLEATVNRRTEASPPPYMAGVAEIILDKLTGEVFVENYYGCVDCGTVINPNLARVQTEGGVLQGIGMALCEDVLYSEKGRLYTNSLMQYKIPARVDIGRIHIEFESSYEESGPFGAKSIGELVIDTPSPAIANAIYNATGCFFYELPMTPEKVAMAVANK